jgi:antitoxin ParD1/3/4/toxin ParE1/3/4
VSRNFVFTPQAEADALAIWEHIANESSERSADRVTARIYDECEKLGEMPGMGHYREELLDQRHRFWSVWSYLIVYRWTMKPIQVVAIIYGARDLDVVLAYRPKS